MHFVRRCVCWQWAARDADGSMPHGRESRARSLEHADAVHAAPEKDGLPSNKRDGADAARERRAPAPKLSCSALQPRPPAPTTPPASSNAHGRAAPAALRAANRPDKRAVAAANPRAPLGARTFVRQNPSTDGLRARGATLSPTSASLSGAGRARRQIAGTTLVVDRLRGAVERANLASPHSPSSSSAGSAAQTPRAALSARGSSSQGRRAHGCSEGTLPLGGTNVEGGGIGALQVPIYRLPCHRSILRRKEGPPSVHACSKIPMLRRATIAGSSLQPPSSARGAP
jgi:hypothetical protein